MRPPGQWGWEWGWGGEDATETPRIGTGAAVALVPQRMDTPWYPAARRVRPSLAAHPSPLFAHDASRDPSAPRPLGLPASPSRLLGPLAGSWSARPSPGSCRLWEAAWPLLYHLARDFSPSVGGGACGWLFPRRGLGEPITLRAFVYFGAGGSPSFSFAVAGCRASQQARNRERRAPGTALWRARLRGH